jgi:hypothetical protein
MTESRTARHEEMARRMYEPQMTPHWPLEGPGSMDGSTSANPDDQEPWEMRTWGPLNGELTVSMPRPPKKEHSGEFLMYWSRIPDFRILEYRVWPNEDGWIARIEYGGTARDGTSVLAHQVDIVTVDERGRLVRLEWHCDSNEWINQVWTASSDLPADNVRELLAKPDGFQLLIDHALATESA